jgi:HEAT repeat protein
MNLRNCVLSANELERLLGQLQAGTAAQRRMAALKLGAMRNPLIIPELITAADDSDDGVRSFIASALAGIGQPAVERLTEALHHESRYVQQMAAHALQHIHSPDAKQALQKRRK